MDDDKQTSHDEWLTMSDDRPTLSNDERT